MTNDVEDSSEHDGDRLVPIAWEALEDAFENNAPEVHSYLHLESGEVIRIVDGVADPALHHRVVHDDGYLRIDPVSSREQYRWMERFIATVEESEFRSRLTQAIDGKGAFRRFKDVLMNYPVDRERWFTFRSERLRACMQAWLQAHAIDAVKRPACRVPTKDEVQSAAAAGGGGSADAPANPGTATAPRSNQPRSAPARSREHSAPSRHSSAPNSGSLLESVVAKVRRLSADELRAADTFLGYLASQRAAKGGSSAPPPGNPSPVDEHDGAPSESKD